MPTLKGSVRRPNGDTIVPPDPEQEIAEAQAYVDRVVSELRTLSAQPTAGRVAYGEAAATIGDVAGECRADVIAMATHGRGGIARFVMGSVATRTLQQVNVPVLMYRPAAVRDERQVSQTDDARRVGAAGGQRAK